MGNNCSKANRGSASVHKLKAVIAAIGASSLGPVKNPSKVIEMQLWLHSFLPFHLLSAFAWTNIQKHVLTRDIEMLYNNIILLTHPSPQTHTPYFPHMHTYIHTVHAAVHKLGQITVSAPQKI